MSHKVKMSNCLKAIASSFLYRSGLSFAVFVLMATLSLSNSRGAENYTIAGDFDGCSYGKLYELEGGGVLECREDIYFYDYTPTVVADGYTVLTIGDEQVRAVLHEGVVFRTRISAGFYGCEPGKLYDLDNGYIFRCSEFNYTSLATPEVRIFGVNGSVWQIEIGGEEFHGEILSGR